MPSSFEHRLARAEALAKEAIRPDPREVCDRALSEALERLEAGEEITEALFLDLDAKYPESIFIASPVLVAVRILARGVGWEDLLPRTRRPA